MKYGLTQKQLQEIQAIVAGQPEIKTVWLFGSRALDTYKEASDIDLAIKGSLGSKTLMRLKDAFEESNLPFFVDLVDYERITEPALKKHIDAHGVCIYGEGEGVSGWCECRLSDFVELGKDQFKPNQAADFNYIGLEHIAQGKLRLNSVGHSSEIASNKFFFKAGDVLFGKLRPYFRKVVKAKFDGVCSTDIWVVRAKKDFSQDFVFYFLANWEFIDTANAGEGGSRMPRADWNFLKNTEWTIPEYAEQKAIAAVLSSLDDKIDLLHRQNKTLESMAETLFRQWFVEEAGEDWEEKSLLDVIELVGGGTPKTSVAEYWDGEIPWLSGGDIAASHKSFVVGSEKTITQEGLENSSAKLLPRFATVISARGTVGKYAMLSKPMAYSQSNYGVLPKIEGCFFFTYLLINHAVSELRSSAYGSVFDTITTTTFRDIVITIPSHEAIQDFEKMVSVYFMKKLHILTQIRTLENLRDTLLPKLMSGEVRVAT